MIHDPSFGNATNIAIDVIPTDGTAIGRTETLADSNSEPYSRPKRSHKLSII